MMQNCCLMVQTQVRLHTQAFGESEINHELRVVPICVAGEGPVSLGRPGLWARVCVGGWGFGVGSVRGCERGAWADGRLSGDVSLCTQSMGWQRQALDAPLT